MLPVQKNLLGNQKVRRAAGCRIGQKKQIPVRTAEPAADDFLKQVFPPVVDSALPDAKQRSRIQDSFFQSLRYLQTLYNLPVVHTTNQIFPYNMCVAYEQVKAQWETEHSDLQLFITEKNHLPVVCTAKVFDTGYSLFYVPLYPLHRLMEQADKKPIADLLLSVFAYLHHAGVSSCDQSGYVGYEMECIQQYVADNPEDWEPDEYEIVTAQMNNIIANCTLLSKTISEKIHLKRFGKRYHQCSVANPKEMNLLKAMGKLYDLYQSFPGSKIHQNLKDRFIRPEIEDRIFMEQYLSFFWGGENWFDDQLSEAINVHLQEVEMADEPIAIQLFDTPQTAQCHDLEFETLFFERISNLNTALYALPT